MIVWPTSLALVGIGLGVVATVLDRRGLLTNTLAICGGSLTNLLCRSLKDVREELNLKVPYLCLPTTSVRAPHHHGKLIRIDHAHGDAYVMRDYLKRNDVIKLLQKEISKREYSYLIFTYGLGQGATGISVANIAKRYARGRCNVNIIVTNRNLDVSTDSVRNVLKYFTENINTLMDGLSIVLVNKSPDTDKDVDTLYSQIIKLIAIHAAAAEGKEGYAKGIGAELERVIYQSLFRVVSVAEIRVTPSGPGGLSINIGGIEADGMGVIASLDKLRKRELVNSSVLVPPAAFIMAIGPSREHVENVISTVTKYVENRLGIPVLAQGGVVAKKYRMLSALLFYEPPMSVLEQHQALRIIISKLKEFYTNSVTLKLRTRELIDRVSNLRQDILDLATRLLDSNLVSNKLDTIIDMVDKELKDVERRTAILKDIALTYAEVAHYANDSEYTLDTTVDDIERALRYLDEISEKLERFSNVKHIMFKLKDGLSILHELKLRYFREKDPDRKSEIREQIRRKEREVTDLMGELQHVLTEIRNHFSNTLQLTESKLHNTTSI